MTDRNNERSPSPKRLKIEAENDQNVENNANYQHHLTLQKMYDTCQEVLDKQKNLEQVHENMLKEVLEKQKDFETSLVDKLRSVESELQLIRDDMKPKTVTASVPKETDNENKTASDYENKSATVPTTGKYFVLKHVFKNITSLEHLDRMYSEKEEHFGVPWRILIQRDMVHLGIFLSCAAKMDDQKMSFDVEYKTKIMSTTARKWSKKERDVFQNLELENENGWAEFIKWTVLEKDFLVDGELTAEVHVNIKKTTGIYKDNLRSFDETMEEFSDVVLVVNEEKFYVLKLYLAAHSPYFKALFLGNFNDSKKSEITLTGIDDDEFQKYLEVLYGESAIDEFTVEGILVVADMYDTPTVIRKCQEFLLEKSKKSLKKKLDLSTRYNLEGLKKQCLGKIKSVADIRSVLSEDIRELDPSIMPELLKKALALHNPQ
ncbi:hypothetical protein GCK72_006835 [Caenorhabditis remanei]|uniref:BTB domain-containing protein n=1 Tax=Caenorhabditis remanei TaxID=31234 RepID=A0A6A5HJU4_CAERE|nr:hypothetical protein GCK72_006835 [Caenorhabditis remanei]KAF1766877.1 hypothetical protein GCK72_006835 [Caenorhabditis remanei]